MKKIIFSIFAIAVIGVAACNNDKSSSGSKSDGDKKEQLVKDEMYTCKMHRQVMSEKLGHCPICGMELTKEKLTAEQEKMMKDGNYTKSKEEQ
jgi:Cu(I)/Ag(I) efflux system membrane fusion protein